MKKKALLILILLITSCTTNNVEVDYTSVTIRRQPKIVKSEPNFLIYPLNLPDHPPSGFLIPFKIMVRIDKDKPFFKKELTKILYSNFLKNRVFNRLVMSKDEIQDLEIAMKKARERKCNIVITPEITYIFLGGGVSPTRMAIKIDIYDTKTNYLIWSITHMGEIKSFNDKDYVFWKTKYNYPPFPLATLLSSLLDDIYVPIKRWANHKQPIFPKK